MCTHRDRRATPPGASGQSRPLPVMSTGPGAAGAPLEDKLRAAHYDEKADDGQYPNNPQYDFHGKLPLRLNGPQRPPFRSPVERRSVT